MPPDDIDQEIAQWSRYGDTPPTSTPVMPTTGLLGGGGANAPPRNPNVDEYGLSQADRLAPLWSGLINAGLLAVAGGQQMQPAERARFIAGMGGALAGIPGGMMEQRTAAAQQLLRMQQVKAGQAQLQQQEQWRALANDPKVKADLAGLPPAAQLGAIQSLGKGDFGTYRQIVESSKPKVHTDPGTNVTTITYPDGSVAQTDPWTGQPKWIYRAPGSTIQNPAGGAVAPALGQTPTPGPAATAPAPVAQGATPGPTPISPDQQQTINEGTTPQPIGFTGNQPMLSGIGPNGRPNWNQAEFDKLPPSMQPIVQKVAEYRYPLGGGRGSATGLGLKGPMLTQVQQALEKVTNGNYDSKNFPVIQKAMTDYSPGGKIGTEIRAVNNMFGHTSELYDAFKNLDPTSSQYLNQIRNLAMTKTGNPNASVVDLLTTVVGGEAMKAITAHATEGIMREWQRPLSSFNSKAQAQAVIESMFKMVGIRDENFVNDWNDATKGLMPRKSFVTPANQARRENILANPLDGGAAAPPPAAGGGKTLKQGADGKWRFE